MSYQDGLPVPPDFEPPKYAVTDEYRPVDPFDIPANQARLAQPTALRPYNGFTLFGLWLSLFAVFVPGISLITLAATHSAAFGLIVLISILAACCFAVPAFISSLIGLYQLTFIGFEKGKVISWVSLILALVSLVAGILSVFIFFRVVNEFIVEVQKFLTLYKQFSRL